MSDSFCLKPDLHANENQSANIAQKTRGVHPISQHGSPVASARFAGSWRESLVTFPFGVDMQLVELVRAESGAKKVSCTTTLQTHCGLDLADAKRVTDAMLEHRCPTVSLQSDTSARSLVVALAQLGVVARFAEGPGYNPHERLTTVLVLVQELLPPGILSKCEALSGHGEWELALSHCLAHLPMQTGISTTPELETLSQLAIEFGIVRKGYP